MGGGSRVGAEFNYPKQIPQNCIYPDLRKDDASLRRFRRVLTNVDRKNSERESEEESRDCHAEAQTHALRSPEVVSFFRALPPAHIFAFTILLGFFSRRRLVVSENNLEAEQFGVLFRATQQRKIRTCSRVAMSFSLEKQY